VFALEGLLKKYVPSRKRKTMNQCVANISFARKSVAAVVALITAGIISCSGGGNTLTKIEIFPANPHIAVGYSGQLLGTGFLSNGVTYMMTILTWSSSDPSVATISPSGYVTAVTAGTTTITAIETDSHMNFSDTTVVTVADIESITVSPVQPSMAISTAYQFVAIANLASEGTPTPTQDLTSFLTWTTSDAGIAQAVNTPGSLGNGIVSTGTTTGIDVIITATAEVISAISGSTTSGSTTLTITSTPLASLAVTSADTNITIGLTPTPQFTAKGTYEDGTSDVDLTSSMTWTTSDSAIATIVSMPGTTENGLISKVISSGTVTITATDPITTRSGSTLLTVN
jgi:hypothetical protein